MADNDSLTPEKRLLQLIEGGSTETATGQAVKKSGLLDKVKTAFSPDGFKTLVAEARDNWNYAVHNRKDFLNLKGANRIAKFFTVGLGIYLLLNMIYEIKVVNSNFVSSLQIPKRETADIKFSENRIFDTNVIQQAEKMNVFVPYGKREEKKEEQKQDSMSLKLVDLIKDWKLAGISIYPNSPGRTFCMIEDLQKNTTSFLKVGDTISGLKIDRINPDSVVLRFNEETIELR